MMVFDTLLKIEERVKNEKSKIFISFIVMAEFFWYPRIDVLGVNVRIVDLLALASFVWFLNFEKKREYFAKQYKKWPWLFVVSLAIIFFTTVSAFLSDNFFVSAKKTVQVFENIWLMCFAMFFINRKNIFFIVRSIFAVAVFHILFAIIFQYYPNTGDIYMNGIVRISGLSAASFATHLLVVFIFSLALFLSFPFSFLKLLLSSIIFVSIILTQIRTIWVLLFFVIFFALFIDFSFKKMKSCLIFMILSTLITLFFILSNRSTDINMASGPISDKPWISPLKKRGLYTANIRIALWKASFEIFKKYPILGSGPGTFGILYYQYSNDYYKDLFEKYKLSKEIDAHSQFFTRLAEIGFLGTTAYLFLFVVVFLRVKKMFFEKKDVWTLSFSLFFITAFLSDIISDQLGLKLFWITLGLFAGLFGKHKGTINEC